MPCESLTLLRRMTTPHHEHSTLKPSAFRPISLFIATSSRFLDTFASSIPACGLKARQAAAEFQQLLALLIATVALARRDFRFSFALDILRERAPDIIRFVEATFLIAPHVPFIVAGIDQLTLA
jgi:hypothetical protein